MTIDSACMLLGPIPALQYCIAIQYGLVFKMEDNLKRKEKTVSIPLKFRGKHFLGLA
jgi:hypothetical protein